MTQRPIKRSNQRVLRNLVAHADPMRCFDQRARRHERCLRCIVGVEDIRILFLPAIHVASHAVRILGDPRKNLCFHAIVARPQQPLIGSRLHVGNPRLPIHRVCLDRISHAIRGHVARSEDDGQGMQVVVAHAPLVQQGMQRVADIVLGLGPLVDHNNLWNI